MAMLNVQWFLMAFLICFFSGLAMTFMPVLLSRCEPFHASMVMVKENNTKSAKCLGVRRDHSKWHGYSGFLQDGETMPTYQDCHEELLESHGQFSDSSLDNQLWEYSTELGTLRSVLTTTKGEHMCLAFWGCCNSVGYPETNASKCQHRDPSNMPTQENIDTVGLVPCKKITAPQAVLLSNDVLRQSYYDERFSHATESSLAAAADYDPHHTANTYSLGDWANQRLNHTWPWTKIPDKVPGNPRDPEFKSFNELKFVDHSYYRAWVLEHEKEEAEGRAPSDFPFRYGFLQAVDPKIPGFHLGEAFRGTTILDGGMKFSGIVQPPHSKVKNLECVVDKLGFCEGCRRCHAAMPRWVITIMFFLVTICALIGAIWALRRHVAFENDAKLDKYARGEGILGPRELHRSGSGIQMGSGKMGPDGRWSRREPYVPFPDPVY